jgi:P4 family phage/plasmid primase-like protien
MVTDTSQPVKSPDPAAYLAAGFRILPIAGDGSKRPLVSEGTFGKDHPDYSATAGDFRRRDLVAILCGPTPGLGADWLAVIDIDGQDSVDTLAAFMGMSLPPTLTSKKQRHLYYRVVPSDLRNALKQWAPMFGRKTEGSPKVDLKWDGGYAIEPPNSWDGDGWDPSAIAVLPEAWIQRLLELRNVQPSQGTAGRDNGLRIALGDLPMAAITALAAVWVQPGEECHNAALALGGILGDSHWTEEDISRFSMALYAMTGTADRTTDILYSVATRRGGGQAMGWPTLSAILMNGERGRTAGKKTVEAAFKLMKDCVPGLKVQRITPPVDERGAPVPTAKTVDLTLHIGSDDEIANKVIETELADAVFDEGELWRFDSGAGFWQRIESHVTSAWIEKYDGVVYHVNDRGHPSWIKLSSGRVSSIRERIEAKRARPGFFSEAPSGLAFQNGFLSLDRGADGTRVFAPLRPEHRARYVLPCDYGIEAARRAPPIHWVRYLRSIWANDIQSIELVHQMIGYLLSGRHDMQKIFLLLGPPRAGKGTLLNLLKDIFQDQCGAFKVAGLDETFGLQGLLGRTVAYDPDVRRSGSMFKSEGQMVERLLSISSHDVQNIPRKRLTDVNAALPCRLLLAANPPFGIHDVGGALASRFVILTFPRSFLGSEDTKLGARLRAEIPAIVALALDGLDRLDAVGKFVEPASSAEERASVERAQNPMIGFLEECTETGSDYSCGCGEMFAAVQKWREANGHKRMGNQAFSEFMRQRGFAQVRLGSDGSRARAYQGIRLVRSGPPALTVIQGGGGA